MLRDYSVLFNFLLTFKDTRTRTHTLHLHSMPLCLNVHVYIFKHIPFCSSFTLRYHYSHTFVLINYGRLPSYLKCLVLSLLGRATPEKKARVKHDFAYLPELIYGRKKGELTVVMVYGPSPHTSSFLICGQCSVWSGPVSFHRAPGRGTAGM